MIKALIQSATNITDKKKWVIDVSSRQLTHIETDIIAKGFNFSINSIYYYPKPNDLSAPRFYGQPKIQYTIVPIKYTVPIYICSPL